MDLVYEVKTEKSFSKAIANIKDSLSKNNFGVLWEVNFKSKLKEKGVDFNGNFQVLEVCNPHKAKEVLEENMQVGYFLPCKIAVYEKESHVIIGMARPTLLMGMMNDANLIDVAKDVESILKKAIDEAVK